MPSMSALPSPVCGSGGLLFPSMAPPLAWSHKVFFPVVFAPPLVMGWGLSWGVEWMISGDEEGLSSLVWGGLVMASVVAWKIMGEFSFPGLGLLVVDIGWTSLGMELVLSFRIEFRGFFLFNFLISCHCFDPLGIVHSLLC